MFDFPEDLPRPMPSLLLRPADKKGADTWFYISPDDSGREYGPFLPGEYEVSMMADAFMPEPSSRFVRIESGSTPRVEFNLRPTGYLRGYVVKHDARDIVVGNSAQPDADIEIQSITLRGGEVHRTPVVIPGEDSSSEFHLSFTDYSHRGTFFFFDLPAGKYELTLKAKGYEPYTEICSVIPGQTQNVVPIELEKKKVTINE
jgi:hypothetical protein